MENSNQKIGNIFRKDKNVSELTKEERATLVEMAVDQFARLFWQQSLLENQNSRKNRKNEKTTPPNCSTGQVAA